MWKQQLATIIFGMLSIFGFRYAPEGLKFGSGVYTNVCGSGLTARLHACSGFCDPAKGTCANSKGWVAKWTCEGKNTECGESEKSGQEQSLSETECNRTVTMAVFDKNCRVGGWSCTEDNLKDYMVWYSGECSGDVTVTVTGEPTKTPSPTITLTPTKVVTAQPSPEATAGAVTVTVTGEPTRTPTPTEILTLTPTLKPVAQKSPETGVDLVGVSLGLVGIIGVGWIIRRKARVFWPL
ncbi:MAG: hypothetical protein G01um101416_795 [Microgenomates group bacterium Gr01-1014_16]|nr:MAG: hypothetical protein G01um101416_795 [Microgenomates group bacterium Gr01-1014_16]